MKSAMLRGLALAIVLFGAARGSQASKEGILAFSSFRLESNGIGASGKIVVEGKQNDEAQIVELKVRAFGKNYLVPSGKLRQLAELPSNGIRLSYEAGYQELGGRTLYIQLQMGFTSETTKKALITITEDGKIEVGPVEEKEPAKPGRPAKQGD